MSFLTPQPVRDIRLAELEEVADRLCVEIARSGFRPDCVVFLETAARLLAMVACDRFNAGAVGVRTQRCGTPAKRRLAPLLRRLPRPIANVLRGWEARLARRPQRRQRLLIQTEFINLPGGRVLVLDDAADTGASVQAARGWVLSRGVRCDDVRVAVLTVTSSLGAEVVDFWLYRELCRFPWSSDSADFPAYNRLYRAAHLPV